MQSSSSDNDSDAMFPSANHQTHAPGSDSLPDISELSPPLSQENVNPNDVAPQRDIDPMEIGQAQAHRGNAAGEPRIVNNAFFKDFGRTVELGHAWTNRKAREEYSRALDQVLDKSFNLSKLCGQPRSRGPVDWSLENFGDPFDEAD